MLLDAVQPALASTALGVLLRLRFVYLRLAQVGVVGHMQSLILAAVLVVIGGLLFTLGVLVDLLSVKAAWLAPTHLWLLRR